MSNYTEKAITPLWAATPDHWILEQRGTAQILPDATSIVTAGKRNSRACFSNGGKIIRNKIGKIWN